jgi:hypothetical protein
MRKNDRTRSYRQATPREITVCGFGANFFPVRGPIPSKECTPLVYTAEVHTENACNSGPTLSLCHRFFCHSLVAALHLPVAVSFLKFSISFVSGNGVTRLGDRLCVLMATMSMSVIGIALMISRFRSGGEMASIAYTLVWVNPVSLYDYITTARC